MAIQYKGEELPINVELLITEYATACNVLYSSTEGSQDYYSAMHQCDNIMWQLGHLGYNAEELVWLGDYSSDATTKL